MNWPTEQLFEIVGFLDRRRGNGRWLWTCAWCSVLLTKYGCAAPSVSVTCLQLHCSVATDNASTARRTAHDIRRCTATPDAVLLAVLYFVPREKLVYFRKMK